MVDLKKEAEFRFSVIGQLLSCPPDFGTLRKELKRLSEITWSNSDGTKRKFSASTIERWYYLAKKNKDKSPFDNLKKMKRSDYKKVRKLTKEIIDLIDSSIKKNPSWSMKLHWENICLILKNNKKNYFPSYTTIKRYLRSQGYIKSPAINFKSNNHREIIKRKSNYYQDSYEHDYVGSLYHLDFHCCSRDIITSSGEIIRPHLFGVIDDCSRLICHLQWYLIENSENLIHGFIQALMKRGLPRSTMSDCGAAMKSQEFYMGLLKLGIVFTPTMGYSPEQNGKIESFWCNIENRLMPMIRNKKNITLHELNVMTQAWVEMDYNQKIHSELKDTPINVFLNKKSVLRNSSDGDELRNHFRRDIKRKVRYSDGTVSLKGMRFSLPDRFRHLRNVTIRFADWDMSNVHLIDAEEDVILSKIYPQNKKMNSSGIRRTKNESNSELNDKNTTDTDEVSELMQKFLHDYKKLSSSCAYLPKDE